MNQDFNTVIPSGAVRGVSLALACLATSLIFTSVTVVFTAGASAPAANQYAAPATSATPILA